MNSPSENETQWIFRQDEIDLFERDYERLRLVSRRSRKHSLREIFKEQEATEEQAQAELELALASYEIADEPCPIHGEHEDQEVNEMSLEELLEPASAMDELSSRASAWSRALRETIGVKDEEHMEKLRIRMNAPLVVAKCTFAAEEEEVGDTPALIIADKELELAEIYLQRVLKSLEKLGHEEQLPQALVRDAIWSGNLLLCGVQERRVTLKL
ncbi:MAG: hypothetical protein AAB337_02565 [Patescibacteria group bacterium]